MENYTDYNTKEDLYQIPQKTFPMDNKVYNTYNYDYNCDYDYGYNNMGLNLDVNTNMLRPATPTSPMLTTYNIPPRVSSPIPRISSPIPQNVPSPIPPRVSSPIPQRIASPVPQRIASPVPQRIASPVPQRIASPVPQRIASPVPQRVASPVPQRISSPTPRVASPVPRMGNPITRDMPHSPLNTNFNFDFDFDFNDYSNNDLDYNSKQPNNETKGLRNYSSLATLRPQKINELKNLRNSNSVASLSTLKNQQQYQDSQSPSTQQVISKKQPFDVIGTPQDQLQKLIFQGRAITNQLQSLSSKNTKLEIYSEGKLPSYDKLVKIVSEKVQVQREINQANARLLTINYIVNITNFCRTHQLHQSIVEGQKKVNELESTIEMLENFIEDINVENENNKQTAERLKCSLDDTRTILENAIKEYRKEIDDHRKILQRQNTYIDSIHNSKFNQDLLVDAGIMLFSMYIVNLPLIDFPLHTIFQTLMVPGRRRAFIKQLAKLIMIVIIVKKLRKFAVQYGIHNKIGSFSPYIFKLINMIVPKIYQDEVKDMTNYLLQRNKKPEAKKINSLENIESDIEILTQS